MTQTSRLAARIQQSLAPHNLAWKDLAIEAYYSPAHAIGGDFGIVLPQGDEFLSLILCDVSGHGIASALMANRIYSETLNALERKTEPGVCCSASTTSYMIAFRRKVFTSPWPQPVLVSAATA